MSTNRNAIFPEDSEEDFSFSYTGADQHWTAPASGELTIECKGAGSNNAAGGYAKGKIAVRKGQKFSIMVGGRGNRSDNGTTYGFGGSTTYGGRGGGGLSGVFTGEEAIAATQASRVVIIAGGAGGGRTGGGAGGGTNGQNGNGGSYGYPGAGGTQTGRGSGGNTRSEQFRGGGGSGTYGFGGGGGWRGGNGSGGDGSGDDDAQAGGGSGHCCSEMTETTLTVGGGAAANVDGTISFHFESKVIVPIPTYVTQAGIYHNPDLGLISMSSDGENWVTIADKNVGATSCDPTDQNSYGKTFQYGNIYGFPGEGDSTAITTSSVIPSLSGYEGGNLYSDSTYRTNMSWLGRNTNLWKGIAFTNLKSLEKGPCPLGFHVPTKAEFEDVIDVLQSIIGEEEEITLETLETYFLMSHPKVRKGSGSFSTDYIDSIYGTLDVELDHDIHLFGGMSLSPGLSSGGTILGFLGFRIHQYSESSALSIEMGAGLANTSMYIRPFRDKAMIPTTEWTRLSPGGHARLPHEYQEVEYIESTGTQYLNLGFTPPSNYLKTEIKLYNTATGDNRAGGAYDGSNRANVHYIGLESLVRGGFGNNDFQTNYPYSVNTLYQIEMEANSGTWRTNVNGTQATGTYGGTVQVSTSRPYFLFANQENGNPGEYFKGRIYYFKATTSDGLIRDLVPCFRVSDGVVGMYDMVDGTFYTNQGTGAFTKGAPVNVWQMPSGYTELAYIQSSGTQYIETDIVPSNTKGVYLKVSSQDVSNDRMYLGSNDNSSDTGSKKFGIGNSSNKLYFGWNSWLPVSQNRPSTTANTVVELENNFLNSRLMKKDNNTIYSISETLTSNGFPINIFGHNGGGTAQYFSNIELYSCKISDGSNIIADFVPCVRDSDGVIGMYDLVTKQFFTNSGTGDFVAGPIVMRDGLKLSINTIAHLLLNGNTDYEGQSITGVNLGTDLTYETVSGDIQAIRFKGNANSWISLAGVPEMNTDFTIGFWIKQYSAGTAQIFVERGTSNTTNCDLHYIMRDTNKIDLGFYANDCAGNTAISASTWYHLCATYKYSTREMKTYINAAADGTLTGSGNPSFGTGPLYLGGKKSYESNSPVNGAMSDFFRENKVWSQEQIQQYVRGVDWKYR